MTGYKAFDKNLCCRGFQFEVGKTYSTGRKREELKICTDTVFHFCRELHRIESESDYILSDSRVCEVIATGDIVRKGEKFGTNEIMILRELTREEMNEFCNRNSGNRNSGDCNSGNWNSGNRNSGDCNSGNWNSGNWNSGFFNTDEPVLRLFNRDTDVKREDIIFPRFLYFDLTVWISHDIATDDEKKQHKKEIETSGGFLKTLKYKKAFALAYEKADKKEHEQLFSLPNFDPAVFEEISGIDTAHEYAEWKKSNDKE